MDKHVTRRIRVALVALGFGMTSAVAVATPAQASHQGTANTGVLNTADWLVCVSGGAEVTDAVAHAMGQIGRTVVDASYVDCHAGTTNVTVFAVDSPETWLGLTSCLTGVVNGRCAMKSVKLNKRTILSQAEWRMTACHEFGHVAGLGHRDDFASCMTVGFVPPVPITFDRHDVEAIDATYAALTAGVTRANASLADQGTLDRDDFDGGNGNGG